VTPRGGRDAVEGWTVTAGQPALKIRVRTAAAEGEANAAVIATLARALGLPKGAVTLMAGHTARVKRLRLSGNPAELAARLAALPTLF
jgi:hypothetical protein